MCYAPVASSTPVAREREMRRFWNARAREDPFYFVDSRQHYRDPDPDHFWDAAPLLDYLLDGLGVDVTPSDILLEIGCGIGRMTRALAARASEVIALDVSDEMLGRARALNPALGNVRWILGDGESLAGIPDESVDGCVSTVVFQHIPDPEITLGYIREVGRVLRAGGWAALQVSNNPSVHRPDREPRSGVKALVGRAPRGMRHPAWVGSAVELPALRAAAADAMMDLARVWGEGSTYCQLLLRRREATTAIRSRKSGAQLRSATPTRSASHSEDADSATE